MTNVTSIKTKNTWNHDADNLEESCGFSGKHLDEKRQKYIVPKIESILHDDRSYYSVSELAETIENNFSKRELAVMVALDEVSSLKKFLKMRALKEILED